MPRAEVLASHSMRLKLKTIKALADKYVAELGNLMSDANPFVRSKALENLRRTIEAEQGSIQVNTQVNLRTDVTAGFSYEERLARIRAAQEESLPSVLSMSRVRLIEKEEGRAAGLLSSGTEPESR